MSKDQLTVRDTPEGCDLLLSTTDGHHYCLPLTFDQVRRLQEALRKSLQRIQESPS